MRVRPHRRQAGRAPSLLDLGGIEDGARPAERLVCRLGSSQVSRRRRAHLIGKLVRAFRVEATSEEGVA